MRRLYESIFMLIAMTLMTIAVTGLTKIHISAAEDGIRYDISFDKEWDYSIEKEGVKYCYSKDAVTGSFEIFESEQQPNFKPELKIEFTGKSQTKPQTTVVDENTWKYEDGAWKLQYDFSAEGEYRYELIYRDTSGQSLHIEKKQVIIIDKTNPEIEVHTSGTVNGESGSGIYQEPVKVMVRVKEKNFNPAGFSYECTGSYYEDSGERKKKDVSIGDKKDKWKYSDSGIWELEFSLPDDYIYDMRFTVKDYAGRKSTETCGFTVDQKGPTLAIREIKGDGLRHIAYEDFQYFGQQNCNIEIAAFDEISGIEGVYYRLEEEGKEPVEGYVANDSKIKGLWICDSIGVQSDFKGKISLWTIDGAGHKSEVTETGGILLESEKQHGEAFDGKLTILTKPTGKVGDILYFNKDVKCLVKASDCGSGLYHWSFAAGKMTKKEDFSQLSTRTSQWEKEFFIKRSEVKQKESSLPISVVSKWEDNAGHLTSLEKNIVIDTEKPEIQVMWEEADSSGYYNKKRTAMITVREANFDERDVTWQISGQNEKENNVSIGRWSHEKEIHRCKVAFEEDGKYQLQFKIADLAANETSYVGETFIIDRKKPVVSLKILGQSENQLYYNEDVCVEIRVKEEHFDEENAEFYVSRDGEDLQWDIEKWEKTEDGYKANVYFSKEGRYFLSFGCKDRAGNQVENPQTMEFVVDKTAPICQFGGIKNLSAYNGKVMPQVMYQDANLDQSSVKIILSGAKNGKVTYQRYPDKETDERTVLSWKDFSRKEETDDIYTLSVYVKDKAGNETKKEVVFSVNRYGSSYELGQDTKKLIENYYTNKDVAVAIKEVNVDPLVKRQVWIKHDEEKAHQLVEGRDYKVVQSKTAFGWMEYDYRIDAKVFEKDGSYKVTFYSKDKAGNEGNNVSRKKEVKFVVDKTAPQVRVTGLEEYEYVTKEQMVDVQVLDAYGTESVMIYVNGQLYEKYTKDRIGNQSGKFEVTLLPKDEEQEIYVVAKDLAGNRVITEKIGCMIHENVPKAFRNAVKVPEKEESSNTEELEVVETEEEEKEEHKGIWMMLCLAGGALVGGFILFPACKKRHFSIK